MFRYLLIYMACLLFAFSVKAQGISNDTIPKEVLMLDGKPMTEKQIQRYHKQLHKDSIRANKRIWWSILGGPSYTPEASFGVGGAVLASFRLNKNDTISQRSFIPAGFNITLNGTFVFAGAGTLFFNENRFRIYISYGYRNEPSHYFGKGYETIEQIEKSDSTTKFHKSSFQLYPRFVWEVRPHLYTGPLFDINFSKSDDINPVMAEDPYFNKFKRDYVNIGVGGLIQYDTRNDVATPSSGMLLSAIAKVYGKYLGGAYNYEMYFVLVAPWHGSPRHKSVWETFLLRSFLRLALLSIFADTIGASTVTRPWRMGFWSIVICSAAWRNIRAVISGRSVVLLAGSARVRSETLLS